MPTDEAPPAAVTDTHVYVADCAMYELPLGTDVPAETLRDALAQLIADAEARGRDTAQSGWAYCPECGTWLDYPAHRGDCHLARELSGDGDIYDPNDPPLTPAEEPTP